MHLQRQTQTTRQARSARVCTSRFSLASPTSAQQRPAPASRHEQALSEPLLLIFHQIVSPSRSRLRPHRLSRCRALSSSFSGTAAAATAYGRPRVRDKRQLTSLHLVHTNVKFERTATLYTCWLEGDKILTGITVSAQASRRAVAWAHTCDCADLNSRASLRILDVKLISSSTRSS